MPNPFLYNCDNTPPADPRYLNHPNFSKPLESSSGFSHLWPGVFHISIQICNSQPRGRMKKKNKQSWAWVSSKRRKVEVCDTFVLLSVCLEAIGSVYSHETSTKPRGMLTHLLALVNPASVRQQLLSAAFLTFPDYSLPPSVLFC